MKLLLVMISTALLSSILVGAAPVYAQEQHDQQEEKQAKPEEKQAAQEKFAKPEEKQAEQEKSEREKSAKPEAKQAQEEKQGQEQERAQPEKQAQHEERHEQPAQRAEGSHGRIPDDRYRANFGREHVFIINRPVIVEGAPRFQYGGYWFGFGQSWPAGWAYSDNVYVEFVDGGYYLYNPVHPGIRIVINVI